MACSGAKKRHKTTVFEGYITQDLDSAEVFRGLGIFFRFFALKDFLSYRPLKTVWADRLTALRFRVKGIVSQDGEWTQWILSVKSGKCKVAGAYFYSILMSFSSFHSKNVRFGGFSFDSYSADKK